MEQNVSQIVPPSPTTLAGRVFSAWLVPGLGHILMGQRRQGVLLFILIGGCFTTGLVLSDCEAVSRALNPYSLWAQMGLGGATLPLLAIDPAAEKVLTGNDSINTPKRVPRFNDAGLLFCNVAGLLNMLVLLDLVDRLLAKRGSSS